MARGFTWCLYFDDDGTSWALQVDSDYVDHIERGWTRVEGELKSPLPRTWRTRYVLGIDELGNTERAIVASVTSDLWTGAVAFFTIRDSEGMPQVCTALSRVAERRPAVRPDPAPTTP